MLIIKTTEALQRQLHAWQKNAKTIGFVPTMGALHEGHLSLVRAAAADSDIVVCSIFVNPTQFNDPTDYAKYPVTIENDIRLLAEEEVDLLYLPAVSELYPSGTHDLETYDLGNLNSEMEGRFRPGHFQGVCQVMKRLLEKVHPTKLFMGQKDYQQCLVVQRLIQIIGLSTALVICPTVRENGGLAMSSRNMRLPPDSRKEAEALYRELKSLAEAAFKTPLEEAKAQAVASLEAKGITVEYIQLADATSLQLLQTWSSDRQMVVLAAIFIAGIRLIDNLLVER